MAIYNIIHQIGEKKFEVKQVNAFSKEDLEVVRKGLGNTFTSLEGTTGWAKRDYPAGRFTLQWRINFNYGKQTYGYIFALYNDAKRNTKTFIQFHDNVANLEDLVSLMNKYSNLSSDDIWELFENSVSRLGMYHAHFKVYKNYDEDLETGYNFESFEELNSQDHDHQCVKAMVKSMEAAAAIQSEIIYLNKRAASPNIPEDACLEVKQMVDGIKDLHGKFNFSICPLTWRGRYGSGLAVGNYRVLS